jgi:hypothetical protein
MAVTLALTLGAVAWIVDQGAGYPLVKVVCASGERGLLTSVSVAAMVLAVCGCWFGFRGRRLERFRFLGAVAIGFNGLVLLYVVMTAVFPYLLDPCE